MASESILTLNNIALFIDQKKKDGLASATLKSYRRNLLSLFKFLPDNKELTKLVLEAWVDSMIKDDISPRTVNHRICTCNNFLFFINRYDLQLVPQPRPKENMKKNILTRGEYISLLNAAQKLGHERSFYLLRTIVSTGIHINDLDKLTVEFLNSDNPFIVSFSGEKIRIPQSLKKELLQFATCNLILYGPVFVNSNGSVIDSSVISHSFAQISLYANVPQHKTNPVNLRRLYFKTYSDTSEKFRSLIEQAYDYFLESEQQMVRWC